ncbi:helicase, RecD/TraA family [Thermoanaerobacter mathranii subsp. mathranii str. A3]|uniref:ATP-dependent RecD2 DNA helicase n=1 Tax=Thermoanaerobacter mathranii subsp. mathranii (strain DSM 11426 / CCUG 53645 / CIP 108742 / A3) TaxID=583358 RepID=A0ABM5LNL2_THEM3|nr:ATP-dependent RecD-like DNA helicase [Thermoanaerobacter mathranii]ADH60311.1 helicase, RecD/TraA family [Thermoanaerobacter mathranii subsp. mathranii str. A3]
MVDIEGVVEEIIFRNEQNGYTVLELSTQGLAVTAVGYMPFVNIGERIKIEGEWVEHPDYGEQIKVLNYQTLAPTTLEGIEKFLASGLIPGIGPVTARKIVKKFGVDSLNIIETAPERLKEIKGLSDEKIKRICEAYEMQKGVKEVMVFLQGYGISTAMAIKIYKEYGNNAIEIIKQNPYRLADDIFGIGFKTADKIAENLGVDPHSLYRISSGTRYVLMQYAANGHTYVPKELLKKEAASLLEVSEEEVEDSFVLLVQNEKIHIETFEDNTVGIYYIPYYIAELHTAERLFNMTLMENKDLGLDVQKEIRNFEKETGILLAENQKLAVEEAVKNSVVVITGGPGTGKTTIINCIIRIFEKAGKKVALAAPTGRAAKRITEATGKEAKTIHRLLEYTYSEEEGKGFNKNEKDPLKYDVIIIDEASMVDILLMNALLKALPIGAKLILVGDADQLPSVGAGNVLRDIIDSGIVKVIRLKEIFRQQKQSLIVVNAHKINNGEYPTYNDKNSDFFFINANTQEDILKTILELVINRLPKAYGFHPINDIQVLTPMRKGIIGVHNLNLELQKALNPHDKTKPEKTMKEFVFRVGDKVMQIKNNYKIKWKKGDEEGEGVFNGDIGIIQSIDEELQELTVYFDDEKFVTYDFSDLDELNLSYAITVHKSQGSEFPVVIIPITYGPPMLLTRNLLYTAVTRARKLVILVGQEKYLKFMIDNNRISKRYSGLLSRLKKTLLYVN